MFKEDIIRLLVKEIKLRKQEVTDLLESPPNSELGDFSFPCFTLANKGQNDEFWDVVPSDFFKKKSPAIDIANHLAEKISKKLPKTIEKVEQKGPYINFFVNKQKLAEQIIKITANFGKQNQSGKVMIEFSQPNTHKAFHVGHIRGTSIGESMARILEKTGKKIIRANYSGDTGMHVAKWIWCYTQFHSNELPTDDESWIASIYVDAVKRLNKNEDLQKQVDEVNQKIESKSDKKINDLWKKTKQLSVKSWDKIYDELNTRFDRHYFESEFEKPGKQIANDLLKKGIAEVSEEAVIINLEKYSLGICVLLRKDGTVLYSAKELALAKKKLDEHKLDEYIIITADEQNMYFKQIFKILELMKLLKLDKFKHIGFGTVRLPQGKMSSRTGENILYSDFKNELVEFAKKGIKKKWEKIKNKELEERALKIAVASMKYPMLSQDPNKVIVFDKEQAMNFEGNTGPYIQYSYARASSILRKSKSKSKLVIPELTKSEIELIKKIDKFPQIIEKAANQFNPSFIANYSYELAKLFNEFYHQNKVIGSKEEAFRIKLIDAFRTTLKNSFNLLGIDVIEEM